MKNLKTHIGNFDVAKFCTITNLNKKANFSVIFTLAAYLDMLALRTETRYAFILIRINRYDLENIMCNSKISYLYYIKTKNHSLTD